MKASQRKLYPSTAYDEEGKVCPFCERGTYELRVNPAIRQPLAEDYYLECYNCLRVVPTEENNKPTNEEKQMDKVTEVLNFMHLEQGVQTAKVKLLTGAQHTYKITPELAERLREDDKVLVTTGADGNYNAGKIMSIHAEPNIQFGADGHAYQWVFQIVDQAVIARIQEEEATVRKNFSRAQAIKAVKETLEEMPQEFRKILEASTTAGDAE